jgi:hypothetical protein
MLGMGVAEEVADSLPEGHGFRATNISGRRFERNRKFVDSPLAEEGFELLVPPQRGQPYAELASAFFGARLHRLRSFYLRERRLRTPGIPK